MNILDLMPYISLAISIITLGTLVRTVMTSGEKALAKRIDEIEDEQEAHDRRIQAVEAEFKHLPDRDSQHRIEINMEKLNGRLDTLTESLKPIRANGDLLNQLLREQVKK